jgi:hypothetical protein
MDWHKLTQVSTSVGELARSRSGPMGGTGQTALHRTSIASPQ